MPFDTYVPVNWLKSESFLRVCKQNNTVAELTIALNDAVSGEWALNRYCALRLMARKAYEAAMNTHPFSSRGSARWNSIHTIRIAINTINAYKETP